MPIGGSMRLSRRLAKESWLSTCGQESVDASAAMGCGPVGRCALAPRLCCSAVPGGGRSKIDSDCDVEWSWDKARDDRKVERRFVVLDLEHGSLFSTHRRHGRSSLHLVLDAAHSEHALAARFLCGEAAVVARAAWYFRLCRFNISLACSLADGKHEHVLNRGVLAYARAKAFEHALQANGFSCVSLPVQ